MRICLKCKEEKELSEFNKEKRSKDGLKKYCKTCAYGMQVRWRQENPEKYRENNKVRNQNERKIQRTNIFYWYKEYKQTLSCKKCGNNKHYNLDLHHLDKKDKKSDITSMVSSGLAKSKIEKELEKCIPLCRNCHSEFHYFEKWEGITIEEYLENN